MKLRRQLSLMNGASIREKILNAAKTASNYITTITGTSGISVHDINDTSNYVNITSGLINIVTGGVSKIAAYVENGVAKVRIGAATARHVLISDKVAMYDGSTELASFGPDGTRVGSDEGANVTIEDRQTLFHGNNGALVGKILSNQLVSGEFEETLLSYSPSSDYYNVYYNTYYYEPTLPISLCEKVIKYTPLSNIVARVTENDIDYEVTIDPSQDQDVTQNGVRVIYNHESRNLQVEYINTNPHSVFAWYYNPDIPSYDPLSHREKQPHFAGEIEYIARMNSNQSVTFNVTPVEGTEITVRFTKGSTYYSSTDSGYVKFTAGTSETKTYSFVYGGSCTINYNAATKTITCSSNVNIAGVNCYAYGYAFDRVTATYDRAFYAPQVAFGTDDELGEYGYTTLFGEGLQAVSAHQTAVGRYNNPDPNDAFEVGSGEYGISNKNAMAVKWNGNTTIAGTLTQSSDKRLKEHISYLGEDAIKFIRKIKPAHFIKDEEHHVGFYAQDVQEADEWDCMTGEMNGYMTLGYTELIAPLVAYCQHLEDRIRKLEEQ